MYLSAEQIAATGRSGMDTLLAFAQAQLAAFEQVSALNFDAGRAALEGGISHARAFMSVKRALDLVGLSVPIIAIKAILTASNSSGENMSKLARQAPGAAKAKIPSPAAVAKKTKKRKAG